MNIIMLTMQNRQNPYWLTYKQCQELGGNVNKGEKGTYVTFWKVIDKKTDEEEEKKQSFILRYYNVFNIEQTTLSEDERFKVVEHEHNTIKECGEIVGNYKQSPKIIHENSGRAFYSQTLDFINVPGINCFDSVHEYYSTLFHELIHSTGHKDRLNRNLKNHFANHAYSKE